MARGAKDFENGQINNTARKKLGTLALLPLLRSRPTGSHRPHRASALWYIRAGNVTAAINATVHVPIRERLLNTLTLTEGGTSSPDAVRTAGGTFSVPGWLIHPSIVLPKTGTW